MSTSSVRRLKERGGGGGGTKITAAATTTSAKNSRSITPNRDKPLFSNGIGGNKENLNVKRAAGKENPRPISRGRAATAETRALQKPVMKAMPRIDKSCAANGMSNYGRVEGNVASRADSRTRWSTATTVQRGRSSSPSEFRRTSLSSNVAKVEEKKGNLKVSSDKVKEKSELGKLGVEILKKSGEMYEKKGTYLMPSPVKLELDRVDEMAFFNGNAKVEIFPHKQLESRKGELSEKDLKLVKDGAVDELNGRGNLGAYEATGKEDVGEFHTTEPKVGNKSSYSGMPKEKDRVESSLKESKMVNKSVIAPGVSKEKGGNEGNKNSSGASVKYQSRLHEKLAFLEGKVKRIATDIKRTKEMLDMNNPDSSKVLLTDIQEKISGIEKAMGQVVKNDDSKSTQALGHDNGNGCSKGLENAEDIKVVEVKSSVKGLSADEVEARLFPHHKLLRNRTSTKTSQKETEIKMELKPASPAGDNPIAAEFLQSLSKEQPVSIVKALAVDSEICEIQDTDSTENSAAQSSVSTFYIGKITDGPNLLTNETLEEFDDQENRSGMIIEEEVEDSSFYQLNEIGRKATTGGWFVSEGEAVLLAHDDGSCCYYDIANCEEKSIYKPPSGVSPNMWRDCWIVRAASADGCSGRYVVAASAGNSLGSGFCSWDFYTKEVRAFHADSGKPGGRVALAPLPNSAISRRSVALENLQWWYKPCGPLITSTASSQRMVRVYDIRDGQHVMEWELQKPVSGMDHSSPLQWRNRGKVVVAESESVSLWDVGSLEPQALMSVSSSNRKIDALHVNNTDAELGGGVRQRVSSSEAEGNDGVFCTSDFINVLDFRQPSGIGTKIPKVGVDVQSVFCRGDSIYLGCTNLRSAGKKQYCSQIQQFSLRKNKLHSTYDLPESDAHSHFTAITQVWGNSELVMGVNGLGLFVFDALKDEPLHSLTTECGKSRNVREVVGPDDLYSPSFDYLASRVLVVSRDRPAMWRYLS